MPDKQCPDCGYLLILDKGDANVGLEPALWCSQCEYEEAAPAEFYEGEPVTE